MQVQSVTERNRESLLYRIGRTGPMTACHINCPVTGLAKEKCRPTSPPTVPKRLMILSHCKDLFSAVTCPTVCAISVRARWAPSIQWPPLLLLTLPGRQFYYNDRCNLAFLLNMAMHYLPMWTPQSPPKTTHTLPLLQIRNDFLHRCTR